MYVKVAYKCNKYKVTYKSYKTLSPDPNLIQTIVKCISVKINPTAVCRGGRERVDIFHVNPKCTILNF